LLLPAYWALLVFSGAIRFLSAVRFDSPSMMPKTAKRFSGDIMP
jgi:hypothetical protein